MATTPRLALPLIATSQAQKEVTHAAGMLLLDCLVQPVVQQVGLNTPPGSPSNGQMWVIGSSPSGAWASNAGDLALRIGGGWTFRDAFVGLSVYDAATLGVYVWDGSAWSLLAPRMLAGSATYDPPSLADGAGATATVTVTGAALGDFAEASFSLDLQGITLTAWVSAADTVSVRLQNETGGALDLGSGTLRARVRRA